MKGLLSYMSHHNEDLEKSFADEQEEFFEKFHDCCANIWPWQGNNLLVCVQAWRETNVRRNV